MVTWIRNTDLGLYPKVLERRAGAGSLHVLADRDCPVREVHGLVLPETGVCGAAGNVHWVVIGGVTGRLPASLEHAVVPVADTTPTRVSQGVGARELCGVCGAV